MKLTVECLTSFTDQDKLDLTPLWPHQNFTQLAQSLTPDHQLFAARFNDRLLGAVIIEIKKDSAKLCDLQIRDVTRRRGVGKYLVEEVLRALPHVREWWLDAADHAMVSESVMDAFMRSCGFDPVSGGWKYSRS
ncbi:aspartate 1-decarboxylase autocleavage activator PanM [Lonsdalea quercina]|uniref:aspartate 1-decarboxylase autocleavage activator PanM n=1 Tax=Lonsdalea quercina TaxID=71657 RepID=UPI003975A883